MCIEYGRGVQTGSLLRCTGLQILDKKRFFRRSATLCVNSSSNVAYLISTYDAVCNLPSSGDSLWRERIAYERLREALVHTRISKAHSRRSQPTLTAFGRGTREAHSFGYVCKLITQVTIDLSTQLRLERRVSLSHYIG